MGRKLTALLVTGGLMALGGAAIAHHSFAMFDQENPLDLAGSVQEFKFTSPHTFILLKVSKDGKVKINQEDSNWDQLGPRIEQVFKERAEKIAFVKGDNEAMFQDVARAIDIMRGAGIDKIGLITAKLEAGQ